MSAMAFKQLGVGRSGTQETVPSAQDEHGASIAGFGAWLIEVGDANCMTRRRLVALFYEFCDLTDCTPLTEGQLLRRARAAGIERYRLSTGSRQWRYRVRSADVVEISGRRAA